MLTTHRAAMRLLQPSPKEAAMVCVFPGFPSTMTLEPAFRIIFLGGEDHSCVVSLRRRKRYARVTRRVRVQYHTVLVQLRSCYPPPRRAARAEHQRNNEVWHVCPRPTFLAFYQILVFHHVLHTHRHATDLDLCSALPRPGWMALA
jgi:hypothetical protein